jgi:hypothetical protein
VHGPDILARSLSKLGTTDRHGVEWQYHSRSDRHSRIGCWGIAFDLLSTSSLMRSHARSGKIVMGVNHTMSDFETGRKKKLDLVIARAPQGHAQGSNITLASLAEAYGIDLSFTETAQLHKLPTLTVEPVGAVLVALEAKACMTAHVKSLPRIYDELNSSHLTVHGASNNALAIAYVQINLEEAFLSPIRNGGAISSGRPIEWSLHKQPWDARQVIDKVSALPRRSHLHGNGFDAIGITVLKLKNDGISPVTLVTGPPAPEPGDSFFYDDMIVRMATEYDATFTHI